MMHFALCLLFLTEGFEGRAVQSNRPVDGCDRERPRRPGRRESNPSGRAKSKRLINGYSTPFVGFFFLIYNRFYFLICYNMNANKRK
ncbi:MAG TPA: hypothetical protein DDY98_07620 [Ruminococcaceae bacterium]|nr:hypothetical protein [Oscillospiraceae bacterium]